MTSDETDSVIRRELKNFDDLQNEIAGRDVGRLQRFLSRAWSGMGGERRDKGLDVATLSALETLMQDPEYAALYNDVSDLLSRAEAATERALIEAERDVVQADAELEETMGEANRLPDGTAVFRSEDGTIRTEDGRLVEGEEAEGIVWKDNAPSYEDFLAKKRAAEAARQRVEDLRRYQTDVLGHARDRLDDHDNPATPDELRDLQREIEEKAPEAVLPRAEVEASESSYARTSSNDIEVFTPT